MLPRDVQKIINSQSPKLLKKDFEKIITERVDELKRELINEFMQHPITEEILAGPTASNTSGVLSGNGNLFAFIGFEKDDQPIQPILNLLEQIQVTFGTNIDSGILFNVYFPTAKEIFDVTPMPWAMGRSWAKGIETGISGLGYFMYQKSNVSRSGEGVQVGVKLNKTFKFKNTAYISHLINKYQLKFKQIK